MQMRICEDLNSRILELQSQLSIATNDATQYKKEVEKLYETISELKEKHKK
jgi:polyhydroxyalkanoate synthesis regulator phasin